MGGTTPNFALRFPYQGEVGNPTHFKNLADDIDAALATLTTQRNNAFLRPAAQVYGSGVTAGAQGATTTLSLAGGSVAWNISGMWSAGSPDRLTCKVAGIYHVRVSMTGANNTAVTAINSFELKLNFAGTKPKVFQHKQNTEGLLSVPAWQCNALWPMAVNDYVQPQMWWSGTGTSIAPLAMMEARLVAYT